MRLNGLHKRLIKTLCIAWTISIAILVAFYSMTIAPKSERLGQLQQTLDEKQSLLESITDLGDSEKKQQRCNTIKSLHSELSKYAICQDEWIQAMPYISTLAVKTGVRKFSSKDASDSKATKIEDCRNIEKRNIEISFEADFPVFAKFMSKLENGSPVVFIDKFGISKSYSANERPTVKMSLSILTSKFSLSPELFADSGGVK